MPRSRSALSLVAFILAAGLAAAQGCQNGGNTFWKRDTLPVVPTGLLGVSVIQGLCPGESAGVVFNMPAGMGPQVITEVVAPWGAVGGTPGFQAILDVEIYDGVSFSATGAVVSMGTMVFSLSAQGQNMLVTSHGLNSLALSAFNIVVGTAAATGTPATKKFAVCFRVNMNLHPTGTCATGYPANFFTDNASPPFGSCNAIITPQKTSIIEILGQGWRDCALATVSGFPLCPLFYSGVWAIRCCTTPAAAPNPFQVVAITPLPSSSPGTVVLQFVGPGIPGYTYIAAAAFSMTPPTPTPFGNVPLAADALFFLSLDPVLSAGIFTNFTGILNPIPGNPSTGVGTALINIPAGLGSGTFFVGFVGIPPGPGPWAISDALAIPF